MPVPAEISRQKRPLPPEQSRRPLGMAEFGGRFFQIFPKLTAEKIDTAVSAFGRDFSDGLIGFNQQDFRGGKPPRNDILFRRYALLMTEFF